MSLGTKRNRTPRDSAPVPAAVAAAGNAETQKRSEGGGRNGDALELLWRVAGLSPAACDDAAWLTRFCPGRRHWLLAKLSTSRTQGDDDMEFEQNRISPAGILPLLVRCSEAPLADALDAPSSGGPRAWLGSGRQPSSLGIRRFDGPAGG